MAAVDIDPNPEAYRCESCVGLRSIADKRRRRHRRTRRRHRGEGASTAAEADRPSDETIAWRLAAIGGRDGRP